ncbi:patatin-like phospholipase family protein [Hypericibacter sp.]|uniref:patatin-like phospholipase family protein n=1 Tax=Hypericibacter sp. TaxID=2705401 RepID=UPI003D6C757F
MTVSARPVFEPATKRKSASRPRKSFGQTVLVLQGGGALGAYQAGVYQGLSEAGIEPDWVIGTSIGAINAALIAGNAPGNRLARLQEFWQRVRSGTYAGDNVWGAAFANPSLLANLGVVMRGVPGFFEPSRHGVWGVHHRTGVDQASWYTTAPLKETLSELVDTGYIDAKHVRLTVGAVNARTAEMRYFDSRDMPVDIAHVMASGALPPAFPAVMIEGEPYWDGGIYSNTPVECVFDDRPRRDSLIFSVNLWQPEGAAPETIWEVMGRMKDIQYSSRGLSHVARQQQLHRLRHVVRELAKRLPPGAAEDPMVRELASYGCGTTMHLVRLLAPRLDNEDHTKDVDFSAGGIRQRWQAGYEYVKRVIAQEPWDTEVDALTGVAIHQAVA